MSKQSLYWRHHEELLNRPVFLWPGLNVWAFYFIVKSLMAFMGWLDIALWSNLAMMMLLVVPIANSFLKVSRQCIAVPVAIGLMYYESSLPPFSSILSQWSSIAGFSSTYLWELLTRTLDVQFFIVLLVAWIAFIYLQQIIRMTVIAFIAIIATSIQFDTNVDVNAPVKSQFDVTKITTPDAQQFNSPDEKLQAFYQEQIDLEIVPNSSVEADFDILLVNICSMSWQDLSNSQLQQHPLINESQLLLRNYNSATSYSGPSALRLLQASCGHRPHQELYDTEPQCLVSNQLERIGFTSELLLNHTGEYDDFKGLLQKHGAMPEANTSDTAPVSMTSFDGSLIRSDRAILNDWLAQEHTNKPRFTFYNTLSLHDGNQVPGFNGNSLESYQFRATNLLDELYQLQQSIKASGRKVVMIIVPEHGANLAGDALQLPGLREIPTQSVTHVPVLISIFGKELNLPSEQLVVEHPTGPSAITRAIFAIHEQQPFVNSSFSLQQVAEQLPGTSWVAENKDVKFMRYQDDFFLKIKEGNWLPYER